MRTRGSLNVAISSGPLFWADRLGAGLARAGHRCTLLACERSARIAAASGVAERTLPLLTLLERGCSALLPRHRGAVERVSRHLFDGWAAAQVRGLAPDVVIGWSSWARATFAAAAERGAATALERGSTHIEAQDALLRDEHRRWGLHETTVGRAVLARERAEYSLARWITVPSRFARDSFVGSGLGAERVEVVPFGVDLALFRQARNGAQPFRVLFVGLVDLRKGVPYLLQAYDRVRGPETELVLMGALSRPMRRILDGLCVPYLHLPTGGPARVAALMAESSALVVPSIEEGLARVILEGMASGLPVIATTASGAADAIDDGVHGYVVGPRDVDALADRLALLRDHPGLGKAMGARARCRVEEAFTWEHYGRRAAEVLGRRMAASR